ncbi:hypothetical protein ACOALZ_13070 [Nocardiopsis algeriensis]|uniref:hypothetical protein n=1 Tax=Nocardiopsis algeriensis TaxID=1478215 RepID=UPI003B434446
MELELLAKDGMSGDKGCPSVYLSDTGEFVVQGVELEGSDLPESTGPLPGGTAVRISPEVVFAAVEHYRRRGM